MCLYRHRRPVTLTCERLLDVDAACLHRVLANVCQRLQCVIVHVTELVSAFHACDSTAFCHRCGSTVASDKFVGPHIEVIGRNVLLVCAKRRLDATHVVLRLEAETV